jgi:hypothetical protein
MVASYSYALVSRKDLPQQNLRELIDSHALIPASSFTRRAASGSASTLWLPLAHITGVKASCAVSRRAPHI